MQTTITTTYIKTVPAPFPALREDKFGVPTSSSFNDNFSVFTKDLGAFGNEPPAFNDIKALCPDSSFN
jgi:hypothetical protein